MKAVDPRIVVVLLTHSLAGFLIVQLNLALSSLALAVFVPALFLPYPVRTLAAWPAAGVLFVTGLAIDAAMPVSVGTFALLLPLLGWWMRLVIPSVRRQDRLQLILYSLAANIVCFLGLAWQMHNQVAWTLNLSLVVLVQVLVSQLFLFIFGGWFILLHDSLLGLFGFRSATEENETPSAV